jgi:hypothetical protein
VAERDQKSSVDILEHVTSGGVHVDAQARGASDVRESSRESILGGVMNAETESRARRRESPFEESPSSSDRSSRER